MKFDMGRMFGFAYGNKENGAVFCHMAVMYAYALYSRGLAREGWRVLEKLYRQSTDFPRSLILPGIPEYFDGRVPLSHRRGKLASAHRADAGLRSQRQAGRPGAGSPADGGAL